MGPGIGDISRGNVKTTPEDPENDRVHGVFSCFGSTIEMVQIKKNISEIEHIFYILNIKIFF